MHLKPARFSGWVVHINLFCLRNQIEMEGKSPTCGFESFISPTFASVTELADVSASEADVFMALRVRVPPLAFLMTVFCKGA